MGLLSQRFGLTRYEADEFYAQALDAYEKDNLEEAINSINDAIVMLPMNSEYHAARGLFYLQSDDLEKAQENFENALNIHAGEMLANYGMGMVSFKNKAWEDAMMYFNRARTVNPTQVEIPYYLALVYHRQQDNATAKTYMQQALDLMEDAGDKRRSDAKKWLREFEKLIKEAANEREEVPKQAKLLPDDELDKPQTAGALTDGE